MYLFSGVLPLCSHVDDIALFASTTCLIKLDFENLMKSYSIDCCFSKPSNNKNLLK